MIVKVSDREGKKYSVGRQLDSDRKVFYDIDKYFTSMFKASSQLKHHAVRDFIRTWNADNASTGDSFISFRLTRDATVYVAYDNRIPQRPDWLDNNFVPLIGAGGFKTVGIDSTVYHYIFYKEYSANVLVSLGGNYGAGYNMYTVFAMTGYDKPVNAYGPELENDYRIVFRAYPNPFNSVTNFTVGPLGRGSLDLEIYSLDGKKVYERTGICPGNSLCSIVWNCSGSAQQMYIARLQAGSRIFTEKLTRMR
jgi:hypothetical protein